ncbi:hypothetical protein [Mucilaginibacter phyllosphaerae]|uniref:Uncharacterized protein n=1 Tax=Mucilaginibacter phyllosphaerae TaxID=1812349 RepID=A0A4Y8AHT4_9SPHI|nr:hypothetical protein [Mucilaginibacter phyllosphaerae]MBB3968379.1 hypothetical protein [Mucilaginibacter phyllosphaerae]TEW68623.1 hypothetical protein E2R65_00215 [Mucilaginibacter phyllosphaerae]GGG99334.1 hypothetical protein GCM10007352_00130 [Mucilaginibacter phyllosphaerae]
MKGKQVNSEAGLWKLKAEELIVLLQNEPVDAGDAKNIQQKINKAFDEVIPAGHSNKNNPAVPNDLELLLTGHQLHKKAPQKQIDFEKIKKYLLVLIGVVMITLGMAMIIMPAPPYFEMFTIFHFTANDGVTLMDLIALVIVFTGVYLPLSTLSKKV